MKYNTEEVKAIHEKGLMWFLFGTLISADSLIKFKDYENSIKTLEKLLKTIPDTAIDKDIKDKYLEKATSCLVLVQKEYEKKKKKYERRKKYEKIRAKQFKVKEIKVNDGKFYL